MINKLITRLKHKAVTLDELYERFKTCGNKIDVVLYTTDVKCPPIKSIVGTQNDIPNMIKVINMILYSERPGYSPKTYCLTYEDMFSKRHGVYVLANHFFVQLTGIKATQYRKAIEDIKINGVINKLSHNFYTGADPEIFIEDEKGEVIPAFNFLPSKTESKVVNVNNQRLYWDGFQAEFEVYANSCLQGRVSCILSSLKVLSNKAKKFNPNARLSLKTVMHIPEHMLLTSKDEHVALGCMPSYNVYNIKGEEYSDGRTLTTRSTGGHLHFGLGKLSQDKVNEVVKSLDAIIGVMCVSLFAKYDDPIRRRSYGLAGEYRLPAHGIEYRTLSNAWLAHPFITHIVIDVARKAVMLGMTGNRKLYDATEQEIIDCINTCDVNKARELMTRNKKLIMQVLSEAYRSASYKHLDMLYNIFFTGMENYIQNPNDIESNWDLKNTDGLGQVITNYSYNEKEFRSGIRVLEERKLA